MPSINSVYIEKEKNMDSIPIPMYDQGSSSNQSRSGSSNSNFSSSSSSKSSNQKRPTFQHSSTSYTTRSISSNNTILPQYEQSQSQSTASYSNSNSDSNPYQNQGYPSEKLSSSSSYPPKSDQYTSSTSTSTSTSTIGLSVNNPSNRNGRNRSVSLSLNEMWDKSRSVCSLKGEHAVGKSMMLGWIVTTLLVLGILACWRKELFEALDNLSKYLSSQGYYGYAVFFTLIFITTIPPIPLYSTLIVLSGYTFGVWEGFVISYSASLVGAVVVFLTSRCWLKDVIGRCLSCSPTSSTLLSILSTHPHLLLLIRIAPYPYNLLNVILASSPTLSLRTYTACTALSLCKLVLHTWIGAGIHNLSESYGHSHKHPQWRHGQKIDLGEDDQWLPDDSSKSHPHPHHSHHHYHYSHHSDSNSNQSDVNWKSNNEYGYSGGGGDNEDIKTYSTWFGITLCIFLFFYLTYIAKKAVKKAQKEDEERLVRESEMSQVGQGLLAISPRQSEEV
ncbi:uncharacterized protein L201_006217 [Kwoniella dendrophila CBS 6074]|uniref:Golgi apparatus membrane protein TVP38 n=1 Tax=Kwoniella dendrophila CBS 6074 TaxID=1295534 RepID=A0AAX4K1L3_9TREE